MAKARAVYETALSWIDFSQLTGKSKAVHAQELRDKACISIRVKPEDTRAIQALSRRRLKLPPPLQSTGSLSKTLILWISPDHYLLIVPRSKKDQWLQTLSKAFARRFAAAIDVSGSYTQLRLGGEQLIPTLNKLIDYDLKNNFPKGKVISTLAGSAPVILVRTAPGSFMLLVRFSYSAYLIEALIQATREYH